MDALEFHHLNPLQKDFNISVLPALSWIKIQLSAVKQYCNTVVGKSSESTGDRLNLLNLAVYSFRERVRYAVL